MPNYLQAITKYIPTAIDKVYMADAATRILERERKYIDPDFKYAGYVRIARILFNGLSDYRKVNHEGVSGLNYAHHNGAADAAGQRDGFGVNAAQLDWEIYRLRYCRATQLPLDHIDNEETAGLMLANFVEEFTRTKLIPEVDEIRLGTLASFTRVSYGNQISEEITSANALTRLQTAFAWLSNRGVPASQQVIFVSNATMLAITNSTELSKYLIAGQYKAGQDVSFNITLFQGRPLIEVTDDRFFTDYAISANNGYHATANSKMINFIVCDVACSIPVMKIEYAQTFGEAVVQDYYGTKTNILVYHDLIVPVNKRVGIYASISTVAATTKTNIVDVDLTYVAANTYRCHGYVTYPAGLLGTLVVAATAFTVGTHYDSGDYTPVPLYDDVQGIGGDLSFTGATGYFAVIDDFGYCVAASDAVTLPTAD